MRKDLADNVTFNFLGGVCAGLSSWYVFRVWYCPFCGHLDETGRYRGEPVGPRLRCRRCCGTFELRLRPCHGGYTCVGITEGWD
jgi:hypothetical protein